MDAYLQRELTSRDISTWLPILQQMNAMRTFLLTMKQGKRRSHQKETSATSGTADNTMHCSNTDIDSVPVGIGIDHYKSTHRWRKRHQRHLAFVQSLLLSPHSRKSQRAPEFWPLDFHPMHHANLLHEPRTDADRAESQDPSAPNFRLHDPQDANNAPSLFWQHSILQSFTNSPLLPSSTLLYDTVLHDDSSEHMGNPHHTDGGIFAPLLSSPHVLSFHSYDPSDS